MWNQIYDFFDTLWGYPMLFLLVGGGLYYGIRTGFFQIRCLPLIFRKTFGEMFKKDAQVFVYAFKPMSAFGGFAGSTIIMTMTKGGFRGIFSNEAGEGTAATVHATAKTDHPVHQGFYGVVEVFIDTIVVCTLTGLAILSVTGDVWTQVDANGEQLTGVYLTFQAFRQALGPIGVGILGVAVALFAYSSYLGFFVEFRTSLEYVFGTKAVKYLKWFFFIPPVISCTLPVAAVWDLADMVVGFIFIPNMIAILALSPQVLSMLKEYTEQCRAVESAQKAEKKARKAA